MVDQDQPSLLKLEQRKELVEVPVLVAHPHPSRVEPTL